MQHPDEGTIHAWLDGALSADEAARVEAHVTDCPECAAAVAEARGFIAASSRILSALDHAPRGVIPAAKPVRRVDPMVWRIAATLLVVAGGTLLVVQNNGGGARVKASSVDTTRLTDGSSAERAVTAASEPSTVPGSETTTATRGTAPAPVAPIAPGKGVGSASRATAQKVATAKPSVGTAGGRPEVAAASGLAQRDENVAADAAAAPLPPPTAPASPSVAASRFGSVAMRGAAESDSLKVIGNPRRLGARVTVYEVGGDTVTFTESQPAALSGIVVTGAGVVTQRAEKAVSGERRAAPMAAQPVDTQTRAANPAPPPPAPLRGAVGAAAVGAQDAQTLRTITWSDPATGQTFTLSGRLSEARLQQLRFRIERERAAKKTP